MMAAHDTGDRNGDRVSLNDEPAWAERLGSTAVAALLLLLALAVVAAVS